MGPQPASGTGTTLLALLRDPSSPGAWEAFVQRYAPKILRWCRASGAQAADAEDVTQEVLYKLARHIRSLPYDPARGSFRAWLKTLTRHTWVDIRDRRRPRGALPADREDPRPPLEEVLDQEFLLEVYEEARRRVRGRVSPATWRAFELLAMEEWPGARVAAELNMSVASVYQARHRVKGLLVEEVRRLEEPGPSIQESRP
jgi:RNA polymerase sigma-70 factor (ECF subfamily)